jgi:hypothetical protein
MSFSRKNWPYLQNEKIGGKRKEKKKPVSQAVAHNVTCSYALDVNVFPL